MIDTTTLNKPFLRVLGIQSRTWEEYQFIDDYNLWGLPISEFVKEQCDTLNVVNKFRNRVDGLKFDPNTGRLSDYMGYKIYNDNGYILKSFIDYAYHNEIQVWAYDVNGKCILHTTEAIGQKRSERRSFVSEQYKYDANGNRTHTISSTGSIEHCDYDDANRLIRCKSTKGNDETWKYDSNGNLTRRDKVTVGDDYGSFTTHKYDDYGNRLETYTSFIDPEIQSRSIYFEYDDDGELTAVKDNGYCKDINSYLPRSFENEDTVILVTDSNDLVVNVFGVIAMHFNLDLKDTATPMVERTMVDDNHLGDTIDFLKTEGFIDRVGNLTDKFNHLEHPKPKIRLWFSRSKG
jgi:YD repeat-containing protein